MTKLENAPKTMKKSRDGDVYEPTDTVAEHNPYDLKVGGKPPCTLADGTVPETVKTAASKAD